MKVYQFIKKVHDTELGKTGINDSYVLVPSEISLSNIFGEFTKKISFIDKLSGDRIESVHYDVGREQRIAGLGQYYRKYGACAGDEILFEKMISDEGEQFFMSLNIRPRVVVLHKNRNGFEIQNLDRLEPQFIERACNIRVIYKDNSKNLSIKFRIRKKKKSNSPSETDFYEVSLDGVDLMSYANEYWELQLCDKGNRLDEFIAWQKYEFNWEE